ncbi:hypothetical protein [Kibdelosporangium philippinense]|uniref:hypothetical protein n=1 Tax=Kibdelosporangium philippinense TaxID=211113 RepID=UPI0036170F48
MIDRPLWTDRKLGYMVNDLRRATSEASPRTAERVAKFVVDSIWPSSRRDSRS